MRRWRALLVVALALIGCAWAAQPPSGLDALRNTGRPDGFAQVLGPRKFVFPADHGPHEDFRHEWWYVTGNVDASTGERFGFELTVFRVALAPPTAGGGSNNAIGTGGSGATISGWRTRQVYVAHLAVTDVARGEFKYAIRFSRDALGLAGAQADPLHVWVDDWMLGQDGADAGGGWKLRAQGQGYELKLNLDPLQPPVLNGDQGLSRKSAEPGSASYYYSIPRLNVRGQIGHGDRTFDVHGLAWLDREWGSGALGQREQGWDWFALQLQDGSALMFYSLRNHDGTRDSHSAGTWVDASGQAKALSIAQVQIDVSDHWTSPLGGRYPSRWRLRVPAVGLDVDIRPALANQELGTQPRYWEGAVDLSGALGAGKTTGRGYVELVGYGE
jgi:predicted secreted hydrolase